MLERSWLASASSTSKQSLSFERLLSEALKAEFKVSTNNATNSQRKLFLRLDLTSDIFFSVNIVRVPAAPGEPSILVHTLGCCECRRPIRTYFFNCSEGCIHHDKDSKSFCAVVKHQYSVCVHCYQESPHTKQHLKKIRPYDPLADNITEGMDNATIRRLAADIKRLQDHEDKREAERDKNKALQSLLRLVPEMTRKRMLPFGNVHTSVMFGPLVFEIGAPQ